MVFFSGVMLWRTRVYELGKVQISLHKIIHVDWFKFCALRNKMDDKWKGNAGGNSCGSKEGKQLAKHMEALESLASEDAFR